MAKEDPMVQQAQKILMEISSDEDVQKLLRERDVARKFLEMDLVLATERAEAKGWKRGRKKGREEGRKEGRKEGRQQGREEGRREAIMQLLSLRGIELTPADHSALMACNHMETLDKLLQRALTLPPDESLFDGIDVQSKP